MTPVLRPLLLGTLLLLPAGVLADDGDVPFDAAIDDLLRKAESEDRDERRAALDSLLKREGDAVVGLVLNLLEDTKRDEVTEDILRAIGLHDVEEGLEPARDRLSHGTAQVRSFAAVCLERLDDPEAKKELLKRVGKERDPLALKNALRASGVVGRNQADVGNALVKRFKHKNDVVAANAVLACAAFREEGKVRSYVAAQVGSMLNRTSEIRVRSACLYSLAAIGTEKEIPQLEKLQKTYRNTMNPLAMAGSRAAGIAIQRIRTGSTDEISGAAFDGIFNIASDDARDPARDGDPTRPVPQWLDDARRGTGRRGR